MVSCSLDSKPFTWLPGKTLELDASSASLLRSCQIRGVRNLLIITEGRCAWLVTKYNKRGKSRQSVYYLWGTDECSRGTVWQIRPDKTPTKESFDTKPKTDESVVYGVVCSVEWSQTTDFNVCGPETAKNHEWLAIEAARLAEIRRHQSCRISFPGSTRLPQSERRPRTVACPYVISVRHRRDQSTLNVATTDNILNGDRNNNAHLAERRERESESCRMIISRQTKDLWL